MRTGTITGIVISVGALIGTLVGAIKKENKLVEDSIIIKAKQEIKSIELEECLETYERDIEKALNATSVLEKNRILNELLQNSRWKTVEYREA
jgi:hypothetical protein